MEDGENGAKRLWNDYIAEKYTILNVESWTKNQKMLKQIVFTETNQFLTFYPGWIDHARFDSELKSMDLWNKSPKTNKNGKKTNVLWGTNFGSEKPLTHPKEEI